MTSEDHDLLLRIDGRLERVEKLLLDNGQPGLVTKVSGLEAWKSTVMVGIKLVGWCIGVAITVSGVIFAAAQALK